MHMGRLKMRDRNYRHQNAGVENAGLELSAPYYRGVENAGPSSYGKPKHVIVAAHRKSSVQLFVGINNVANAFILVA